MVLPVRSNDQGETRPFYDHGGGPGAEESPIEAQQNLEYHQELPLPHLLLYLPLILLYDLSCVSYGLLAERDPSLLRGPITGLTKLGRFLKNPMEVQAGRCVPFSDLAKQFQPLENPLQMWRRYRYLQELGREEQSIG